MSGQLNLHNYTFSIKRKGSSELNVSFTKFSTCLCSWSYPAFSTSQFKEWEVN